VAFRIDLPQGAGFRNKDGQHGRAPEGNLRGWKYDEAQSLRGLFMTSV
jgi:hypothetical protein